MIVGLAGIIAGGGLQTNPPYGTLLSSSCTQITIYDTNSTEFTGYYNKRSVYADGAGGTYINNDTGSSPCHYPYGFYFQNTTNSVDLSWSGCSNSGTLYGAGTQNYSQMADGSGGTITNDSTSWNYSDGYYIYDNGTDCRVIFDSTVGYPYYYVQNYGGGGGCETYGTKSGTPYWNSSEGALWQNYNDGMCGVYSNPWDGTPPYPLYGVQIANPSYGCGNVNDANGISWYMCFNTYTYADGSNGSYTTSTPDGYYPSGYALTATGVNTGNTDMMWYVTDTNSNSVYPWLYGYSSADGYGGSFFQTVTPPYYTILSGYFYEYWSGNGGYIYADGNGGYFFGTSSPP
jgi:hypothetical protein